MSRDRISSSTTQRLGWILKSWRYESLIRNCNCYASFISQDQKKHIIPPRNIVWFLDPASMCFFLPFCVILSQKSVILYFLIGFNIDLRSVSTHCTLSLSLSPTESSGGDVFCSEALQWHDERGSAARLWGMVLDSGCGLKLSVCGNTEIYSDPLKQGFSNWALQVQEEFFFKCDSKDFYIVKK